MQSIRQSYFIRASLGEIWESLINPTRINTWGGGPAKMDDEVGTGFSLWGGSIWGKNIEVIKEKKLVQEWFSDSEYEKWEKPSIVTFELQEEKDNVRIDLTHIKVPDRDAKSIEDGWREDYLGPLKEYLEKK